MINELVERLSLSDRFFYFVGAGEKAKIEEIGWELFKKYMGQEYYSYASEIKQKANLPDKKIEPLLKPHLKDIILRNYDGRRKCFPELALPSKLSLEDKLSAGLELIKNRFGNIETAKKLMGDFDLSYDDVAQFIDSKFKSLVSDMQPSWDEDVQDPYVLADRAVKLLQAFPYQPSKEDALIVFTYLLNKNGARQEKAIKFMQRCDLTLNDVKSFTMRSFFGEYSVIFDLLKTHIDSKNSEGVEYLVKTFEITPKEFKEAPLRAVKFKLKYDLDLKTAADISKEYGLMDEELKEPATEVYRELVSSGKYGSADVIADKYGLKPEDTHQIIRDKCKDLIEHGQPEKLNEFRNRYGISNEEFNSLADGLCRENLRKEYLLSTSIRIAEKCGLDYLEELQTIKSKIDLGRHGER